jgi:hypothetical protein
MEPENPDFEAEILGNVRRDRVVYRWRMDATVSVKDRAKALAPFGPIHEFCPRGVRLLLAFLSLSQGQRGETLIGAWPPSLGEALTAPAI